LRESISTRRKKIKKAVPQIITYEGAYNLSTRKLTKETGLTEDLFFSHILTNRNIIKLIMSDFPGYFTGSLRTTVSSPLKSEVKLFNYLNKNINYLKETEELQYFYPQTLQIRMIGS
jgi:hypothetical protein